MLVDRSTDFSHLEIREKTLDLGYTPAFFATSDRPNLEHPFDRILGQTLRSPKWLIFVVLARSRTFCILFGSQVFNFSSVKNFPDEKRSSFLDPNDENAWKVYAETARDLLS